MRVLNHRGNMGPVPSAIPMVSSMFEHNPLYGIPALQTLHTTECLTGHILFQRMQNREEHREEYLEAHEALRNTADNISTELDAVLKKLDERHERAETRLMDVDLRLQKLEVMSEPPGLREPPQLPKLEPDPWAMGRLQASAPRVGGVQEAAEYDIGQKYESPDVPRPIRQVNVPEVQPQGIQEQHQPAAPRAAPQAPRIWTGEPAQAPHEGYPARNWALELPQGFTKETPHVGPSMGSPLGGSYATPMGAAIHQIKKSSHPTLLNCDFDWKDWAISQKGIAKSLAPLKAARRTIRHGDQESRATSCVAIRPGGGSSSLSRINTGHLTNAGLSGINAVDRAPLDLNSMSTHLRSIMGQ